MKTFQKNLDLFARFHPEIIPHIKSTNCSQLTFCQTKLGEMNLQKKENNQIYYLHSQEGARKEAQEWFISQWDLVKVRVVFCYGLGLGYHYEALKGWLKQNSNRFLVFLEHDLRVISRFLETEKATEILNDPQVGIYYFDKPLTDWGKFRKEFDWLFFAFAYSNLHMCSLKHYLETEKELMEAIFIQIKLNLLEKEKYFYFHTTRALVEFESLYLNLFFMPECRLIENLQNIFQGLPAIVCGAGPSLEKQFSQLKELGNCAIIFGAGSALNALSSHAIYPHLGVALDPTASSSARLMAHFAYMTPIFFVNNISHEGFYLNHGERIYTTDPQTFDVTKWFLEEWGINLQKEFHLGTSSAVLGVEVAHELGCKPIITVGLDLAYTDSTRYPKGLYISSINQETIKTEINHLFNPIKAQDIYGNEVYTKLAWISESAEYAAFADKYKNTFYNSTEGGIAIEGVPNRTLENVSKEFLFSSYDILNKVHVELQNSPLIPISFKDVFQSLNKWKSSLKICLELIKKLIISYDSSIEEQLKNEVAYFYFIGKLNEIFDKTTLLDHYQLKFLSPDQQIQKNRGIEINRYFFFKRNIEFHLSMIDYALQSSIEIPKSERKIITEPIQEGECYSMENNYIKIIDPYLNLHIEKSYDPNTLQKITKYYPEGGLKEECYYLNKQLHGSSTFFSKKGKLLARSWFVEDKRTGKTEQYDEEGHLLALLYHQDNLFEGQQRYFYSDGLLKAALEYSKGELNGTVQLFYANGAKKREVQFLKGQLNGYDRIWRVTGSLWMEAQYHNNQPINYSRKWYANGQLAKELSFHEESGQFDLSEWNLKGEKINHE